MNNIPNSKPLEISKFKAWCQSTLPLVYTEELTVYECLCKIVETLNEVIENNNNLNNDFNSLLNSFNLLKKYVDTYFENLDVQEEINNKLDEMVENGDFGEIFENIVLKMPFNPDKTKKERYQDYVCSSLVSYLVRNYGSDCIASGSPIDNIVIKYHNLWDYMGLFGIGTFHKNEKISVNGVEKNVIYLDCSTFSSLILRGRNFPNSVYHQIFNNNVLDDDTLREYAKENPLYNMDYTLDWFNNVQTSRDAFIMENSGNNLKVLWDANNTSGKVNNIYASNMETGDILFFGRSGNMSNNRYMGIYHCGIFVKSLEDLNKYAVTYGITLQALPSNVSDDLGYIVEMNYPTSDTIDYKNCLSIRKLRYYAHLATSGNDWYRIFTCKPNSNALNSNKYLAEITGMYNENKYKYAYNPASDYSDKIQYNYSLGEIALNSIKQAGKLIPSNSDAHTIDVGFWRCTTASVLATITNIPFNTSYFTLEKQGTYINGAFYGNMIFTTISDTYPVVEFASCLNGEWTPWKRINRVETNSLSFTVPANSTVTKELFYKGIYDYVPSTVPIINSGASDPKIGNISVYMNGLTKTGCNISLANANDVSITIAIYCITT